jgi:hypothetical protein
VERGGRLRGSSGREQMKFKVQLVAVTDDGREEIEEAVSLQKEFSRIEELGLTLAESKEILKNVQKGILERQAAGYTARERCCELCGRPRRKKGHHDVIFRTLFGNVTLRSPRLHRCSCQPRQSQTFSPLVGLLTEHTSPELLFMETKWASLVSYGMSAAMLKDVLPVDEKLNASTLRNHLLKVAGRGESDLGDEQFSFIDSCPRDWAELPHPKGLMTVGMDGGYVRDWENKKSHFEVIVGKLVPWKSSDSPPKTFGFVQNYDIKPKRRLFDVLISQGMQMNQQITFVSDGVDNLRDLQVYLNPQAEHVLDWFHIAMRLTVLGQYAKGVSRLDRRMGEDMLEVLERIRWYLWHGNLYEALRWIESAEWDAEGLGHELEERHPGQNRPGLRKLHKSICEFKTYIERNGGNVPNYGERWRHGEVITTSFVESTVNAVVSKRFCKKQQMQWTSRGAHLLLQTRTKVLNGELVGIFELRYPGFREKPAGLEKVAA